MMMKNNKKFNLTKQFGLFSFVSILLLAIITGYILSNFLTEKLLWREATLTQEFVDSIVQTDNIYSYFSSSGEDGIDPRFNLFFHHLSNMRDVVKAKVYAADMTVLWDSESTSVGMKDLDNDELELSLKGNLVTEFGLSRSVLKEEHKNLPSAGDYIHFIETYIPVWNGTRSQVTGVIELYKQPRILHEAIEEGRYLVWSIALLGAILLYASLFWIVFRGDKIINRQKTLLVESESLSMIGETASAVAHAMRNSLASIRASAELTMDDDLDGARESATDIMNEADRLNRWAGELLKFSEDGGDKLIVINIVDLLEEVINEHRGVMKKEGVVLKTEFRDPNLLVEASTAPLSQVFGNLIMNAIEAMQDGGDLNIRVFSDQTDGSAVWIEIIDTGSGLSDEIIGQLFKPFATTKATGTGLGLALTRRLLNRYDGTVSIHSGSGRGVTARVILPQVDH
jgi:signal transduction histidine kinase